MGFMRTPYYFHIFSYKSKIILKFKKKNIFTGDREAWLSIWMEEPKKA